MQFLWETSQRARKAYFCDRCCEWICSGDRYRRHIWIPERGRFYVEREHEDPDCPVPEYEMGDSEPCEMEEEVSISFALRETIREVILVDGSLGTEKGLELVAVLGADIPDDPDDVPF